MSVSMDHTPPAHTYLRPYTYTSKGTQHAAILHTHHTCTPRTIGTHAQIPHTVHTIPQPSPTHHAYAMHCPHLPPSLSASPLHTMSVKVWREPQYTFGSVTGFPPPEACLENVLWLCGWLWLDVLGVGCMETILDTYCECTSVSQKIFSALGTKAYVTCILLNSASMHSCVHRPVLESGIYRLSSSDHVGGQRPQVLGY